MIDFEKAFNPNQPRDWKGRWSPGGAGPMDAFSPKVGMTLRQALDEGARIPVTATDNSPGRKALRAVIRRRIFKQLDRVPRDRKIDFIIGKPGAGKTTMVNRIVNDTGSFNLDPDQIKEMLPEYKNGLGAAAVHQEASDLSDQILFRAMHQGSNIIIQGTGKTFTNLLPMVRAAKEKGYRVNVIHVQLPTHKALERMTGRFVSTGRPVHPDVIRRIGNNTKKNFRRLLKEHAHLVDGHAQYDSDVPFGQPHRTIHEQLAKSFAGRDGRAHLGSGRPARAGYGSRRAARALSGSGAPPAAGPSGGTRRKQLNRKYNIGPEMEEMLEKLRGSNKGDVITKIDEEQRVVAGWASVITDEAGEPLFDLQNDGVEEHELVLAAHEFMKSSRSLGKMHKPKMVDGKKVFDAGKVFEHFVVTRKAHEDLGLPAHVPLGWLIAAKVHDDDAWARVKSGEFRSFSIGGGAVRVPVP